MATLSGADVRQHGGAVAIYGGTNLKKLDTNYGTTIGQQFAPILCAVVCPEVTDFGYMALADCIRLAQIDVPKCVNAGGSSWDAPYALAATAIEEIELPKATFVGYGVFLQNYMLRKVSVPAAARVHQHAFENCAALELVDFGNDLEAVPSIDHSNAFRNTPDDLAIVVPDALYEEWIASGHWATVAETKHIYRHSDWMQTRGGGVPVCDLSGYVTTNDLASITNGIAAVEWLSPWSWPDEWSLSVEASGNTPAFSGYVPNKDVYAAVTAPGASFPTSWEAVVTPEACAIPGIVDPPEVSVSVDDPYGAVAAVTGNVAYASGSLGQFAFVASDTNGVERRAYVIAAPAPAGKTNELFAMEGDGTERWVWTTNVLARLNAVSTNAGDMVAHVQCRTASNRFDQAGTGTWMAPRALSRFGTGGRNYTNEWPASYEWGGGVANRHWCLKENEDFFWPELRTNLWCYTVNCHESVKPKWNFRAGSAIAVAPHYIVSATHFGSWMWGPGQTWTDSPRFRFGPGTNDTVFCRSPRQVVSKVPGSSDIELCRVTNDIPAQCIAHFAREATLRALSPTFFRGCPGFVITSHQTLAPAALSPYGFSVSWTGMPIGAGRPYKNYIPDDELVGQVPWLEHVTHMFDSASPFFLVAPNGRVVPVGQVYSTGGRSTGGPTYFDDDVLDAIDAAIRLDSGGAEGLSFWEFDDLWSGFGTNSVPEL